MKTLLATLVAATATLPAQYNPTVTSYGYACGSCVASFHEAFATGAAFDLAYTAAYTMIPTSGGYVVAQGTSAFVPPSGGAVALSLTDDGEVAVALPLPFPHACEGPVTTVWIAANGVVSMGRGNPVGPSPMASSLLGAPRTAWWCWRDMDPSTVTSGRVVVEHFSGTTFITWDAVEDYGGAGTNTFQFQFDCATGLVHLVFESMSTSNLSTVIGYSPAGPSSVPGPIDLTNAWPIALCCSDSDALRLDLVGLPRIGTTPTFVTSNIDSTMTFGIIMFGLNPIVPGFDLGNWGAPGCQLHVDWFDCVLLWPPATVQTSTWWAFSPVVNYPGVSVYGQALTFDNLVNVMHTSNALDMRINP